MVAVAAPRRRPHHGGVVTLTPHPACGGGECGCRPARPTAAAGWAARLERRLVPLLPLLPLVHIVMFALFLLVVVGPLLLPPAPPQAPLWRDAAAAANFLLWGLWFPLMFLSVIGAGRAWCGMLCPMGAAAEWGNRLGPRRAIPAWLRWPGTPIVSFVIITVLGQTVGVRDHPEAVAEIFGGTMAAAVLCGLLYGRRKRAWCRHACPIGLLLGVFSRLGAVEFAPRALQPGAEGYTERGICPTMIDLAHKHESRHCIECLRCVNPEASGGVHLRLRAPGSEIAAIRRANPNGWEVGFLFLAVGIALGGFLWLVLPQYQDWRQALGESALDLGWTGLLDHGPSWLMSVHPDRNEVFLWLDFVLIAGFMLGSALLSLALLGALTALAAGLAGRAGASGGFSPRFVELGYQFAPVAMMSLVLGLGAKLFELLALTPLGPEGASVVKGLLFLAGLVWSLWLGNRILAGQGLPRRRRIVPLLPGLAGSLAIGVAWLPAIFGS